MAKMKSDTPLDYAVFQLSPNRSRCELFVSCDGITEKVASGLLKPFASHLKTLDEQVASSAHLVKLESGQRKHARAWFTKGTLERFVRFVTTPEVLELVSTLDAEISQLEAARRIYSQGTAADDATKKELVRAIDVRLDAVGHDLFSACSGATAAGFNIETVSQLQMFAARFGAHRLGEACCNFVSLCDRRPDLFLPNNPNSTDGAIRSSYGSDMSMDDDPPSPLSGPHQNQQGSATCQPANSPSTTSQIRNKPNDAVPEKDSKEETLTPDQTPSIQKTQHTRRLSVQDRISLFENKQKENSDGKPVVVKSIESKKSSADVAAPSVDKTADKDKTTVLRRWSGSSDMSIDLSTDNPCEGKKETVASFKQEVKIIPNSVRVGDVGLKEGSSVNEWESRSVSIKSNSDLECGESDGLKGQLLVRIESKSSISRAGNQEKSKILPGGQNEGVKVEILVQKEDSELRDQTVMQTRLNTSKPIVGESGSRIREAFAARFKGIESDSSSDLEVRSVGENKVVEKKDSRLSEKVTSTPVLIAEDPGPQKMMFNRQGSASEQNKKPQVRRDESSFIGVDSFSTPPPEQVQRLRQSKVNQERNDELKVKADELEKLFAEHKLRVPVDQSNSVRKGKSADTRGDQKSSLLQYKEPASDITPQLPDNYQSTGIYTTNKDFSDLSISEGSRGKSYERYMKKRDAKLRGNSSSIRAEKESRLKSMWDSLERSKSEMKTKFSGDLASSSLRAERRRSYNSRSIIKREQLDFEDSEEDKEALDFLEKNRVGEDSISKVSHGKKLLPNNKSFSSSTGRTTITPVPRSSIKTPTINSGRRKTQLENPLAQSVPNFSNPRKENTKPSSGPIKPTRSQARNFSRSKSTIEEAAIGKEDKSQSRTQSLRRNPSEFREMSPLESDVVPVKFDDEVMKIVGTKKFLKKGSRSFIPRATMARQKSLRNDEENDEVKDERDIEFETVNNNITSLEVLENEEPSVNSGSENGDSSTLTFSQIDQALGSYPHEISDVDASIDSPIGSPASWNSQSLETDASARMRKKWGAAQKPILAAHSPNNLPRKDTSRGFKRFLKFGRKNRGSESLVDWISVTTSEGDDDTEDRRDITNRSSEDLRKTRMGFSQGQRYEDSFNESEFFNESVQSPAHYKVREDHVTASAIKAPKSFFSLSSFLSK